jgi:hypothetical protein
MALHMLLVSLRRAAVKTVTRETTLQSSAVLVRAIAEQTHDSSVV